MQISLNELPWIEVGRGANSGPLTFTPQAEKQAEGHYAIFAAQIHPKPFDQRLTWKWGFNAAVLLDEALDRQRLFIEAQHPADIQSRREPASGRALALRCLHEPGSSTVELVLLARVWASNLELVQAAAFEYWDELQAIFPYDYTIQPITSPSEFERLSGKKMLHQPGAATPTLAEVRRYEALLADGQASAFVFGKWQPSNFGNEQIWRALANCPMPVFLNVYLRPTILLDEELLAIAEMKQTLAGFEQSRLPILTREAGWATQIYQERLLDLRYPFLLQVHLVAAGELPEYLLRAVGSALTHPGNGKSTPPGYRILRPTRRTDLPGNLQSLLRLEPLCLNPDLPDPRFTRLRFMADTLETSAVFRLPYPPVEGIPGVSFSPQDAIPRAHTESPPMDGF